MPDRLSALTGSLRDAGRKVLVPFLTAGYPDPETCFELLGEAAEAGCPLVEIGVPFSDPVADGPVIQAASQRALAGGMTLAGVLDLADRAHREFGLEIVLMGYLNPLLKFGPERFAEACARQGVAGLIVPDLPAEEAGALRGLMSGAGTTLVDLVAPTTPPERLAGFGRTARGFLYLVSTTGVTGTAVGGGLEEYAARVRAECPQPMYVGFGISGPEAARATAAHADGVIIGSALLRIVAEAADHAAARSGVRGFLNDVNLALSGPDARGALS